MEFCMQQKGYLEIILDLCFQVKHHELLMYMRKLN